MVNHQTGYLNPYEQYNEFKESQREKRRNVKPKVQCHLFSKDIMAAYKKNI